MTFASSVVVTGCAFGALCSSWSSFRASHSAYLALAMASNSVLIVVTNLALNSFSSTLRFAAYEFHITDEAIRSRSRVQSISLPRQVAVYLAAKNHLQSLAGMGRYLKMDHTTMIHAKQKITALMASDATLRDRILALETRILAAFNRSRTSFPALGQPLLDCPEEPKNGNSG